VEKIQARDAFDNVENSHSAVSFFFSYETLNELNATWRWLLIIHQRVRETVKWRFADQIIFGD